MENKIIVLDFGSQYNQLITRRIRNLGVYSELVSNEITAEKIKADKSIIGIVFSGGPNSVYENGSPQVDTKIFELGKAVQFGDGVDGTVFATGVMVAEALKAQKMLKEYGIDIRVVDMISIKPIDENIIAKCARETDKLVSVEDHSIIGGLGTAIAEVLTEKYPIKLKRMGMKDCFGKSGKAVELMKYFGLNADAIVKEMRN